MLSKLRTFQPVLQSTYKRFFNVKKPQPQPTNSAQQAPLNNKEAFIDIKKFQDEMLLLYNNPETTSSRIIASVLLSIGSANLFHYFFGDELTNFGNEGFTSLFIFGFLALYEMKLHRTPKSIYLHQDGKGVLVEFYRLFGFGAKPVKLNVSDFKGYGPYIKKFNKIPIVRYEDSGKKKMFFFKVGFINENEILRQVFAGYNFKVGASESNIKISNKSKARYDL